MQVATQLVRQGFVTADDFVAAVEKQLSLRKPFGVVAIRAGLLRVPDVFRIVRAQLQRPEPFGRTAQHLGLLNETQIALILLRQQESTPSVTAILVADGKVTQEQVDAVRGQARRDADAETRPSVRNLLR